MELDSSKLAAALEDAGVDALYHANTVTTACTFLSQGALLARGVVADRRLPQTPQSSDSLDKLHRIWRDLFVDAVDIHDRIWRRNLYGPVLFVFDLEMLRRPPVSAAWVTRKNPTKWNSGESRGLRFFRSVDEFARTYNLGDFDNMIVIRNIGGVLPLRGSLRYLLVDNPGELSFPNHTMSPLPHALQALRKAARQGGLKWLRIRVRDCPRLCGCHQDYATYPFDTRRLYAAS
jgi:hypothetical protein